MPPSFPHRALCALAACMLAGVVFAQGHAAPLPTVKAFFANQPISHPSLSPDGKRLAVVVAGPDKRYELAVIDLSNNKLHRTAHFEDLDIGKVHWVNNERLVFDSADHRVAQGDREYAPGMYAINYDGKGFRQLAEKESKFIGESTHIASRMLPYHTYLMEDEGAQDSDAIYVRSAIWNNSGTADNFELLLLDTVTGKSQRVSRPGPVWQWLLDRTGQPRLAVVQEGAAIHFYYSDPATRAWQKISTQQAYGANSGAISPLAFGAPGKLYVESARNSDTTAVYEMDLASGKLADEPLISAPGYDFAGDLKFSKGKLVGLHLTTDARASIWFDPAMKAIQQAVDKQLPGTVNIVSVPARPESPWVLVESYSDVQPSVFYAFNGATSTLNRIGAAHPEILPAQMGRQEMVQYKARDGLSIPALLTWPAGGKRSNLPLVMLVHGGPWVRGPNWGWNAQAQFLASRGYAVLEPSFRGTTGFGHAHFAAGWKQWGLAMQNDIADGARWAVAKGMVDPKRICIAGASYGGYSAMMGLVNDPDLYKCAVNWVGVSDIALMYKDSWGSISDASFEWRTYGMPKLIGDQVKDAAQLKATSPLEQAARIKQPLLLAYGGADLRVPRIHGELFYNAVRQGNKQAELVMYPAEGHGWYLPETRYDFWARVEQFLQRHIGTGAE